LVVRCFVTLRSSFANSLRSSSIISVRLARHLRTLGQRLTFSIGYSRRVSNHVRLDCHISYILCLLYGNAVNLPSPWAFSA
jgi:hypothetical protein